MHSAHQQNEPQNINSMLQWVSLLGQQAVWSSTESSNSDDATQRIASDVNDSLLIYDELVISRESLLV